MTETPAMTDVPVPPYDDGYDEPEFTPRPRRRAHTSTFVLAAAFLVAAGFLGGVLLQKHEDNGTTSSSVTGTGRARFGLGATGATGGTGGGAGGGRGFGLGGGAVTGQVKLVDGKNVYVTDSGGNVVKVTTNSGSQLTKTDPAVVKDVAPGDVVIVRGTQNRDGSYTATSLVISPAGATPSAAAASSGSGG